PDDPSEIVTKVLWMLDRDRWPSLSEQARRLGERYSWENHFRELENHLLETAKLDQRETLA
ncbi:MAG: hypothetical protein V3W19_04315, partial [Desulfatiglandales bacterium]